MHVVLLSGAPGCALVSAPASPGASSWGSLRQAADVALRRGLQYASPPPTNAPSLGPGLLHLVPLRIYGREGPASPGQRGQQDASCPPRSPVGESRQRHPS